VPVVGVGHDAGVDLQELLLEPCEDLGLVGRR
jgi:hypothetical protein